MRTTLTVNNIKCGGCENSIKNSLSKIDDLSNIEADSATGNVSFDYTTEEALITAKKSLHGMGYTETDPNLVDTAKSYVSCIIGKMK